MTENELTERIIGSAIEVHRRIGPGLLESIYAECMAMELTLRGVRFQREVPVPVEYRGQRVAAEMKIDLLVDQSVVVELKAVERLLPVHDAQLLTYLRLTHRSVGLLINFNVPVLKSGLRRLVNNFNLCASASLR